MDLNWQQFATELRASREAQGLTKQALAKRADVTITTIDALESGRSRRRIKPFVEEVAQALGWPFSKATDILKGQ